MLEEAVSDHYLHFVPTDPLFRPSREAALDAEARLKELAPHADSVESDFCDEIEVFHAGENWEGVACPVCSEDATGWWSKAFDSCRDPVRNAFGSLDIVTPCCGAAISLNDLNFKWPWALGVYSLTATNAGLGTVDEGTIDQISDALGCRVRLVYCHM